jgi:4-hydroxy-tetrahydrodipicolinate synthase
MTVAPGGVIPAIPTPFTPDGASVDEAALRRVVRHVVDGGVHGIMTTGGTGEFPHLSREERRRVTEVVVSETAGAVPVFAGPPACSTVEAGDL